MSEKVTIEVEADVKEALEKLGAIEKGVKDVGTQAKAQTSVVKGLANGFRGVGLAMKAAGFGFILELVKRLWEQMQKNQEIADTVTTAFNMIGVVMGKISKVITEVVNRTGSSAENFDALGRIIKNLMTLSLTPLKLAFNGVALVIKEVQLAWEKSWLGKGDQKRIAELTAQITGYKEEIRIAGEEAIAAGKGIIVDFREGVGELQKLGKVVVEEFDNTFKNLTVKSVYNQAKAVTSATNNLSLLEAKHEGIIKQFEKDAELQRKIRDDVSKSIDDRIKANDELLTISEKQAEAELKALKEKESGEQKNALLAEQLSNQQELAKIGVDEVKRQEQEFINEKDRLIKIAELTISNEEELAKKKEQINIEYQNKKDKLDAEGTAKEKALQEQRRQIIGGALTGLTALIGAETKAGKGLAVAQATMDTYAGATKALAQGGIFGTIAAAGVIASGLANVRSILQTDIPGESGGGAAPSIDAGASIEDTIPTVPTFGAIGTEPPPVQAFVVESDVSSSQALQNDLNLQATL